jgi:hypothetical protein
MTNRSVCHMKFVQISGCPLHRISEICGIHGKFNLEPYTNLALLWESKMSSNLSWRSSIPNSTKSVKLFMTFCNHGLLRINMAENVNLPTKFWWKSPTPILKNTSETMCESRKSQFLALHKIRLYYSSIYQKLELLQQFPHRVSTKYMEWFIGQLAKSIYGIV